MLPWKEQVKVLLDNVREIHVENFMLKFDIKQKYIFIWFLNNLYDKIDSLILKYIIMMPPLHFLSDCTGYQNLCIIGPL